MLSPWDILSVTRTLEGGGLVIMSTTIVTILVEKYIRILVADNIRRAGIWRDIIITIRVYRRSLLLVVGLVVSVVEEHLARILPWVEKVG